MYPALAGASLALAGIHSAYFSQPYGPAPLGKYLTHDDAFLEPRLVQSTKGQYVEYPFLDIGSKSLLAAMK